MTNKTIFAIKKDWFCGQAYCPLCDQEIGYIWSLKFIRGKRCGCGNFLWPYDQEKDIKRNTK